MRPGSRGVGGLRARIVAQLAAAVGAVALLAAGAVAPAASQATTTGSLLAMSLIDQSPWVAPVGSFDLQVAAGAVPADAQIVARIYVPISTQAQLDRAAKGQSLGALVESVTVPAAGVNRGTDGSLMLSYAMVASGARSPIGFLLANPGVYPFSLQIVNAHGDTIGQLFTQLIRLPAAQAGSAGGSSSRTAAPAPLSVALVVPVGAPVARRPDRRRQPEPGGARRPRRRGPRPVPVPVGRRLGDAGARNGRHPGRPRPHHRHPPGGRPASRRGAPVDPGRTLRARGQRRLGGPRAQLGIRRAATGAGVGPSISWAAA